MLPTWTLVGFTGHRNLANVEVVERALGEVLDRIEKSAAPLAVVSSAASGADTLFLEEVSRRGIPFFLILPFHRERFRADFSEQDWGRAEQIVEAALDCEVVTDADSAPEAYLEASIRMVDQVDLVVAVWDGESPSGRGGTTDAVDYARSLGKPLWIIDPASGEIREERCEALTMAVHPLAGAVTKPKETVEQAYAQCDRLAGRHSFFSRNLNVVAIILLLIAAAAGVVMIDIPSPDALRDFFVAIKFGSLILALVVGFLRNPRHKDWVRSRVEAELCRSFLMLWSMRRSSACLTRIFMGDFQPLVRSLRMLWYLDPGGTLSLSEAKKLYVDQRVHGQLNFFSTKYHFFRNRSRWLQQLATGATLLAIGLGIPTSLPAEGDSFWKILAVQLMVGLLPLVPPVLLSLVTGYDMVRRAERAEEMTLFLKEVQRRLDHVQTWPGLLRIVQQTESVLLHEVFEWQAVTRFAGK